MAMARGVGLMLALDVARRLRRGTKERSFDAERMGRRGALSKHVASMLFSFVSVFIGSKGEHVLELVCRIGGIATAECTKKESAGASDGRKEDIHSL